MIFLFPENSVCKNYFLVNTLKRNEYCHLIPEWYGDFADITPFTIYSENLSDESILLMLISP